MIKMLKNRIQSNVVMYSEPGKYTDLLLSFKGYEKLDTVAFVFYPGQCTINWGDGIEESFDIEEGIGYIYHKYDRKFKDTIKDDEFLLRINGNIQKTVNYINSANTNSKSLIRSVYSICKRQSHSSALFSMCKSLKYVNPDAFRYCSISDFKRCFAWSGLTKIPQNLFDSAGPDADFAGAFANCRDLTTSHLKFGGPNASTFRQFDKMFMGCNNLESIEEDMFDSVAPDASFTDCFKGCNMLDHTKCKSILKND